MTAMSLTETDAAVLARWRADGTAEATVYSTAKASVAQKGTAAPVIAGTEWLTEMSSATTGFLCEAETAAASTAGSSRAGTAEGAKSPHAGKADDKKKYIYDSHFHLRRSANIAYHKKGSLFNEGVLCFTINELKTINFLIFCLIHYFLSFVSIARRWVLWC